VTKVVKKNQQAEEATVTSSRSKKKEIEESKKKTGWNRCNAALKEGMRRRKNWQAKGMWATITPFYQTQERLSGFGNRDSSP
jgi:hypothetical protein